MKVMKTAALAILGASLVGAVPTAAQAQSGGRSGHSTAAPLNNMKAYRELGAMGVCVARIQRRGALLVVASEPGSDEEDKALGQTVYGERSTCMFDGTKMSISSVLARGVVAEGLLKTGGLPANYRLAAPNPGEARDLHGVARCYVAAHRSETQALLKTELGSREETAAVAALWPELKKCQPNMNARLTAPWIRLLLAEALLRLDAGSAAQAAGK